MKSFISGNIVQVTALRVFYESKYRKDYLSFSISYIKTKTAAQCYITEGQAAGFLFDYKGALTSPTKQLNALHVRLLSFAADTSLTDQSYKAGKRSDVSISKAQDASGNIK